MLMAKASALPMKRKGCCSVMHTGLISGRYTTDCCPCIAGSPDYTLTMEDAVLGQYIQAVGIFLFLGRQTTKHATSKQLVKPLLLQSIKPTDRVCKLLLEAKVAEVGFCCVHFGLWVVPA